MYHIVEYLTNKEITRLFYAFEQHIDQVKDIEKFIQELIQAKLELSEKKDMLQSYLSEDLLIKELLSEKLSQSRDEAISQKLQGIIELVDTALAKKSKLDTHHADGHASAEEGHMSGTFNIPSIGQSSLEEMDCS